MIVGTLRCSSLCDEAHVCLKAVHMHPIVHTLEMTIHIYLYKVHIWVCFLQWDIPQRSLSYIKYMAPNIYVNGVIFLFLYIWLVFLRESAFSQYISILHSTLYVYVSLKLFGLWFFHVCVCMYLVMQIGGCPVFQLIVVCAF